jgi:tRNA (guanine37-N1)-methyltransferase
MARLLKEALKAHLTDEELRELYASFDVIGDIAIIKIPSRLEAKKQLIGQAILQAVKPVRAVFHQVGPVEGEWRVRGLELIAGEDKRTTLYREHGCRFKVAVDRVYFSPRLSTERLRIARRVGPGEVVVNLFAGVGTFSIIIARHQPRVEKVYSIDINPDAVALAQENVKLNKVEGLVEPILGDAAVIVPTRLKGVADRVLMPLPERAREFLGVAEEALKSEGGYIHYYTHVRHLSAWDAYQRAEQEVEAALSRPYLVVERRVVREVGPRVVEVGLDIRVTGGPPG